MVVTLVALLLTCPEVHPPPANDYQGWASRGIDLVYNLEFERAEVAFGEMVKAEPRNPAGYFFLAMVDWWRIMIDMENEQYDRKFVDALDGVIEMCDSLLALNPADVHAMFFKGGAIGFKGRLMFHRNDYFGAANAGRKALPIVQDASAIDPENYDVLLGTGIYNYYADVIPNEYPFVKPLLLFIPPGDRKKGIEELTRASEKGRYASVEATYFLLQIYSFYEKDFGRALALARRLHERFPNNMLFHRYVGRSYASMGDWPAARGVFRSVVDRCVAGWRGYGAVAEREALYYLGYAMLQDRQYDSALTSLYRCDELSRKLDRGEASGFMAMANLKIGNIYDVQGKRELAIGQYEKVLQMKQYKDSHTLAEMFLKSPFHP